jgi:hypothetical protein
MRYSVKLFEGLIYILNGLNITCVVVNWDWPATPKKTLTKDVPCKVSFDKQAVILIVLFWGELRSSMNSRHGP